MKHPDWYIEKYYPFIFDSKDEWEMHLVDKDEEDKLERTVSKEIA